MNLAELMRTLMDGKVHRIRNTSGIIHDRITEVGTDRTGQYVTSAGRVKLYITRHNGPDLNTRID